jgi:hypothetical protein
VIVEGQCLDEENKDERQTGIIVRSAFAFTFPWIETVCGATVRDACSLTTSYLLSSVRAKQTLVVGI